MVGNGTGVQYYLGVLHCPLKGLSQDSPVGALDNVSVHFLKYTDC